MSESSKIRRLWLPLLSVVVGGLLVSSVRAGLAEGYHKHKIAEKESLLLPTEYTGLISLGHREALADYLYGMALVDYGLSFSEKRAFTSIYRTLDTITSLAPTYAQPYIFSETLLTLQAKPPPEQNYRDTLALHDKGLKALPYYTELWFTAGQYAAYIASTRLPKEKKRMRLRGARLLARACELAGNDRNMPRHCLNAASMLNKAGHRSAVIRMLTRTLAVNDDPQTRSYALGLLRKLTGERERERQLERLTALEAEWKSSAPFVSRTMISLLGPSPNAWACAGPSAALQPACVSSWRAWSAARRAAGKP